MSYTKKTLEELNALDDFLMNAIVTTPEISLFDAIMYIPGVMLFNFWGFICLH